MKLSRRASFLIAGVVIALATACATQRMHLWTAPAPVRVEGETFSGWGPEPDAWAPVRVATRAVALAPMDENLTMVGRLVFRGGLELQSDDPRFGGLSGVYVEGDGRLIAVSDRAQWFVARLVLDVKGDLKGLVDARMADIRDTNGELFRRRESGDSEDVTRLDDGRFAVSFEQSHSIRIYDLDKKGPAAATDAELKLAGTRPLGDNESLESLAPLGDGLLTAGEGELGRSAPFWIVPLKSDAPPSPIGMTSTNQFYSLVSIAPLPDGDFLAMERFFAPIVGARIHLRRVSRAGLLATPARWEGETIADLEPPASLDNFEGLAVTPGPDGGVRLYIVSDDNFSAVQRTLLYAFDLKPPPPTPASPPVAK
jgi:hypothetical protein